MGIDALLRHLEEDATREATRLRRMADEAARELMARADADAARARALHLERVGEERRRAGEREVATARAAARSDFLRVRAALLDRILARAVALLEAMPADRYRAQVGVLAAEAARYLEGAPAVLECPPDALDALTGAVDGRLALSVRAAAVPAGVMGASADGRVVVDNSLPALLARQHAELTIGLAARIEGD